MIIGIDASRAFVPDPAGPEYYSLNLIKNISNLDKVNRYILYLRAGQKVSFKLPANFEVRVIRLKYLWTQFGLASETILRPPDLLFIPSHTLPLLTRILRPRLPIVVTIHGLEGKYLPQSGNPFAHIYRNWSISWAVRFSTALIAVSKDTKNDIIKTYKLRSKTIKVIQEGVDFARFVTGRPKFVKKFGNYILFVGTIQPRKNLVRLIKAFALLLEIGNAIAIAKQLGKMENLCLVIAGKPGWLYDNVLAAPKRFGVQKSVKFVGRVADRDLPDLYAGAKAFVLPSLTEGFGLPILEAQAAKVPVVAAKTGALPEISGGAAVLVNPRSVKSIKEGIEEILVNKALAKKLIKEGVKNARKLSWKKTAYSTIEFFREIAGSGKVSHKFQVYSLRG